VFSCFDYIKPKHLIYVIYLNIKISDTRFMENQSLAKLLEGNQRFVSGVRSVEPMFSHLKMAELAEKGQKPFAIILTCSDSRSPVEMIFDQGIGELFVVRVAGNVVAPSLLASIEFAAANFGCSLILVLGHSRCGAVNATLNHHMNPQNKLPSAHLEELVGRIRPAVERTVLKNNAKSASPELVEHCAEENVHHSLNVIQEQSTIVRQFLSEGKLTIAGGILDIHTGKVKIIT
jgi:carbonic anhydrase